MPKHGYTVVPTEGRDSPLQERARPTEQSPKGWIIGLVAVFTLAACLLAMFLQGSLNPTAGTTAALAGALAGAGPAEPASQVCRMFDNNGAWTSNYTSWRFGEDQQGALSALIDFIEPRTTGRPRHVLLAGDSTFARLNEHLPLENIHSTSPNVVKEAGRCDLMEYYGLPRSKQWIPPNRTEGPIHYGLENPFCTDCAGCDAVQRIVVDAANRTWTYEYLPIEFARDREHQTPGAGTSQETAARYLNATYPRDLCILSSVIHDTILDITLSNFADNVLQYLHLMQSFCQHIVWLLPSASLNDKPQTLDALLAFRGELQARCIEMSSQVLLFDIWNMSLPEGLHADNVHHVPRYYQELGKLLLQPRSFLM